MIIKELPMVDAFMDDTAKQRKHLTRNTSANTYLRYILPCDVIRVVLSIILFCALVLFIRQSRYVLIEKYRININSMHDNESTLETGYLLIDVSNTVVGNQGYQYDVMFMKRIYKASKIIQECKNIPEELRFDCHPEDGVTELSCIRRGCCWKPPYTKILTLTRAPLNVPYCYYPKNWSLYKYRNYSQIGNEFSGFLQLIGNSFYKKDLPLLKVEASDIDDSILRLKIYDANKKRYEPPWPIRPDSKPFEGRNVNAKYTLNIDTTKPGFKVYRASNNSDNTVLFDSTGIGGFIFADQFLQISSLLASHNIYGIGEHQSNLKLNTSWQSFTLFNKDQPPVEKANLYGSHPFYLVVENSGKSHGVLLLNSNAMDVILQPSPAITFRTIGGIFDIYFFLGPTPADVIKQYSKIVGKPFLPPYWSLGFHLCRYGYGSLEGTKEVWKRTIAAGIPFDTQWNDLDYMDKNNDFTYSSEKFKDLPQFLEELHTRGMHYIPLIDAGVSASERNGTYLPYDEGLKDDIFVKDETNNICVGKVWNYVSTVWPDFTNPKAPDYYLRMMSLMHESFAYDGAWIDMNEPSNFYDGCKNVCSKNDLDYPVYVPNVLGGKLRTKTLCMNAKHYLGTHYDLHNTYGTSHAIATNYALVNIRKKRPFIISRSTWVGHGYYAGHWTGDLYSSWYDMKMTIPAILSLNFYQIPMVGADICGFNGNATVALCNRWMQLGAFYPFSRNHNSDDTVEQDPAALGELVIRSSKRALKIRYWLLPYLYTLFFRAHKFGETVVRPLFFEFPEDPITRDIDTQFLWGGSLMIVPVLKENEVNVTAYLPRGVWYDFYTKKSLLGGPGKWCTLDAPLDTIPLMIRGGSVLPGQKPALTTTDSRKNGFDLLIVLDQKETAQGELYWDDGDSLDSLEKGQFLWLSVLVENNTVSSASMSNETTFDEPVILDRIQIWGVAPHVSRVSLNGREIEYRYNATENSLLANKLQTDLRNEFTLRWEYERLSETPINDKQR
ncbi:lysosomal alpha-glucosidase isoform X2 [Nomia melanderi]|uniref:lysosomal alpha-glucosidase isoform X2 n=1 Tax=Nomia melanderi TaxID=2448451 RepID=UPI001304317D|nr:lysosomal alpha-glucosidase-like isoform X2 [Nomia melanderi]